MNTVWLVVVCISIVFAAINGRIDGFTKAMFEAGKAAVEVCLYLVGIVSLWLGLTKILEDSGLIYKLSNFFRPAISFLFRNIPEGHPSITAITLNLLANLFGLGNAATPLGIKAMEDLQTLNTEQRHDNFRDDALYCHQYVKHSADSFYDHRVAGKLRLA